MQQSKKSNSIKFGNRVRSLREKTSGSLNAFVLNKGGVSTATWSRIENGVNDIKLSSIIKIASMLEMSVSELLQDIDFDYSIEDD